MDELREKAAELRTDGGQRKVRPALLFTAVHGGKSIVPTYAQKRDYDK